MLNSNNIIFNFTEPYKYGYKYAYVKIEYFMERTGLEPASASLQRKYTNQL